MAGYLSNAQIANYRAPMDKLHDTFARDIVIYQTAQRIVISTNPNHNFLYATGPNQTETQETVVRGVYQARIWYPNDEGFEDLLRSGGSQNSDQVNVKRKDYAVVLVVNETVRDIVKTATRIEFDGTIFDIESDGRTHGVIGPQFYNFGLKALN